MKCVIWYAGQQIYWTWLLCAMFVILKYLCWISSEIALNVRAHSEHLVCFVHRAIFMKEPTVASKLVGKKEESMSGGGKGAFVSHP